MPQNRGDIEIDCFRSTAVKNLAVLTARTFVYQMRNPGVYWVRLVMYILLSLMIGTIYFYTDSVQDKVSVLFFGMRRFLSIVAVQCHS